jgi:hypothetical protein
MIITRNTVQREIILQTVLNMDNHPSADEVYEKLRFDNPPEAQATVLQKFGMLQSSVENTHIEMPKCADSFEFNTKNTNT